MTTTKTTPKKCTNFLLEADGYCCKCGRNHFDICFGKVYFHQPDAVNKEVSSSYEDMPGSDYSATDLWFPGTSETAVEDDVFPTTRPGRDEMQDHPELPLIPAVDKMHPDLPVEEPRVKVQPSDHVDSKQLSLEYTRKYMSK